MLEEQQRLMDENEAEECRLRDIREERERQRRLALEDQQSRLREEQR